MAKYLIVNPSTGNIQQASTVATSEGLASADSIPALGSAGRLDVSLLPDGIGVTVYTAIASEDLQAGNFVHLYSSSDVRYVQKASAIDHTKPANGYVLSAYSTGQTVTVYVSDSNSAVPVGSYTLNDLGRTVFLDTTAGLSTKTVPSGTGNIIQKLGDIVDVGSTVVINYRSESFIIL